MKRALYFSKSTSASYCSKPKGTVVLTTFQATPSVQGGVVSEPSYSQRGAKVPVALISGEKSTLATLYLICSLPAS